MRFNPFRKRSAYAKIFDFVRKSQTVTRKQLRKQGFSTADISIVLSPRANGNQGHTYYMEKLSNQRFRLRFRNAPIKPNRFHACIASIRSFLFRMAHSLPQN